MKAAFLEEIGSLVVREVPDPPIGPYDALCQLLYGATCSGTDLHLIEGRLRWAIDCAPTIIGHESVGRVMAVGDKVRNFKVGDLVTRVGAPPAADGSYQSTWGGFASLGVAGDHWAMAADGRPKAEWDSCRVNRVIPPDFDPRACPMITTWRETLSYITRMGVAEGSRVLIFGSGGNGLSYAAHASNLGAAEIIMSGNTARQQAARRAGVTTYLDYKCDDLAERLTEAAGDGFDYVIDAVGKKDLTDLAVGALKVGGTLGIYGIDDMGQFRINPDAARGSFTIYNGGYDEAETHEQVVAFMQAGLLPAGRHGRRAQSSRKLDASIWLDFDSPFSLDDINAAFDAVRQRKFVKALVKLSPDA